MIKGIPAYSYLRLSAADGREEESHSIANQREFLRQWARRSGFALQAEFVDDGHTGTDFERPAFQALMEALRKGPVRCFVTVDLSRLGRNYLEVGRLQEEVFPALGIRYIAVNDDYDSARQACGGLDPAVFKNLINDLYAKDASQKALRAKRTLQRQGKYLGGSPPYGYRLDSADRYRLLPDGETAPVVRRIYEDCLAGQSCAAIARALTGEGVPSPAARKAGRPGGRWSPSTVRRILTLPTYRGDLTQHLREMVSYKVHKSRPVCPEDWIVVENTHPALVSREDFARAGQLLGQRQYTGGQRKAHPLTGLVFCADCGSPLYARQMGGAVYLVCHRYASRPSAHLCTAHYLREDALLGALAERLQVLARQALGPRLPGAAVTDRGKEEPREETQWQDRLAQLEEIRFSAYRDKVAGILTPGELEELLITLRREQAQARAALEGAQERRQRREESEQGQLEKLLGPERLNRALLSRLVRRITVGEGRQVRVEFAFRPPVGTEKPGKEEKTGQNMV